MKLPYLLRQVFFEPALITPEAHTAVRQLLESRLGQPHILNDDGKREGDFCGEAVELPSMEIINGVAHIPIAGVIGSKLSGFAKFGGAVDTQDIAEEIDRAMSDKKVKAILFDIDSPGGMVTGTPELADAVASITKPKYAFTSGMIASAAYWIAAGCDAIFATRSASIGSIGVYMPIFDETRAFESQGVKVELIKAGTLKGIGFPGTTLSDAGREHLQQRVDDIYKEFTLHVRSRRGPQVTKESMQGQTFMAGDAMRRFLVDAIVRDKRGALAMI